MEKNRAISYKTTASEIRQEKMRKLVFGIMLALILLFVIQHVKAEPATIVVPTDYPVIHAGNADSIFDTSHTLSSDNVDYLPLAKLRAVPAPQPGAIAIGSCSVIFSPGFYVLNRSILDSNAAYCINITSSDVIFEGQGYTIDGIDASNTFGVHVNNLTKALTNITVKNVTVMDWSAGIYYRNAGNGSITGNRVSSNGDGISLDSSNYNNITGNTAFSNNRGIGIGNSINNTIANNTLSFNTQGIALGYSSWNTIVSNIATSNWIGIELWSWCSGNLLIDNIADHNEWAGIHLGRACDNNILINNSCSFNNPFDGIVFDVGCSENLLVDNNASHNTQSGFRIWDSSGNRFVNNTANYNSVHGFNIQNSNNNVLTCNTANYNRLLGILLFFSNSITFNNNIIKFNDENGIRIESSKGSLFYNNYFNNTNNIGFSGTIYPNTWNTTKTPGVNIAGGNYLGGNFWANPSGTGFSQTCNDTDFDGICNANYTLAADNIDYLPLALPPVLPLPTPTPTYTESSGGGGGGGGGAAPGEPYENVADTEVRYILSIARDKQNTISFTKPFHHIVETGFAYSQVSDEVSVTLEKLINSSLLASGTPPGVVFENVNIWVNVPNPGYVSNASIKFSVEKNWISTNNIDPGSVAMYRFKEGSWSKLPTNKIFENKTMVYYHASAPGFSPFAIVGERVNADQSQSPVLAELQPTAMPAQQNATVTQSPAMSVPGFDVLLALAVVAFVCRSVMRKSE